MEDLTRRILTLEPNFRIDYLRERIAAVPALKAEWRQLVDEWEIRKKKVDAGELPERAAHVAFEKVEDARRAFDVDFRLQARNSLNDDANTLFRELDSDRVAAGRNADTARRLLSQLKQALSEFLAKQEGFAKQAPEIVSFWDRVPGLKVKKRDVQETAGFAEFEQRKTEMEREIDSQACICRALDGLKSESDARMNFFCEWLYSGKFPEQT